jgi:hypothetical protein
MDTWEVVFILALVTISLIILINHNIPIEVIMLLDNSLFQLAIVGLTLLIAVVSPPVAIVSIATIIIIYYTRNLIKVQLITNDDSCDKPVEISINNDLQSTNEPRLFIEEVKTVETTTRTQHLKTQHLKTHHLKTQESDYNSYDDQQNNEQQYNEQQNNEQQNNEQQNNLVQSNDKNTNTKPEDVDVLETVLNEEQYRNNRGCPISPTQYKIPGAAPFPDIKQPEYDTIPDPRIGNEGFHVDSMDSQLEVNGKAPNARSSSYLPDNYPAFAVDTKSENVPVEYNELSAPPTYRPYSSSEGQYEINENRPYSSAQKYEVADFIPGNELGSNEFAVFGESIDDKMSSLKKTVVISKPPPNFDEVVPSPSTKIVN